MLYLIYLFYIHWPFCLSLCPYCDFNSHILGSLSYNECLTAYQREIDYFAYKISGRNIKSIFFGGGTPSLMPPFIVREIISYISKIAFVTDNTEITLEANPTSYEANNFAEFKSSGVNRISIGVQSLRDDELNFLGRKHSAKEALSVIESTSKIFDNYSFDLIYGLPNQTIDSWAHTLTSAMKMTHAHISLYQLTIEKGTKFFRMYQSKEFILPDDDKMAELYQWTNDYLANLKYHRYEISNYSKIGYESIHNLTYWNYGEYLGIGAGAHSRLHEYNNADNNLNINALMMFSKPEKWKSSIISHGNAIQINKTLSKSEIVKEYLLMGTRLADGIDIHKFRKVTSCDINDVLNSKLLKLYVAQGLVILDDKKLCFSDQGLSLQNYLITNLIDV